MANLSVDFAFEGFRIIRAKPQLIPVWGIVLLAFYAGLFYLFGTTVMPAIAELQGMKTGHNTDPSVILGIYQRILPMYGILIPGGLVLSAIMNCAIYRAVLGSKASRFGYLRIGADELRQIGVNILFFLIFVVGEIVVCVVCGIVAGIAAATVPKLAPLIILPLVLAPFGLSIWAGVRMSLFGVQTFDTRKINLFGTWSLTKGHFWPLLGGYLVMIIMALVVELLFMIIFGVVGGAAGLYMHSAPHAVGAANPLAMIYANPVILVTMAVSILVLGPLMLAIMVAPLAAAYRAMSGRPTESVEEVFG